jgi:hypothetical protein
MGKTCMKKVRMSRGGNWAGRVGFGFGSGQFDFLKEIGPGQFTCCVFSDL